MAETAPLGRIPEGPVVDEAQHNGAMAKLSKDIDELRYGREPSPGNAGMVPMDDRGISATAKYHESTTLDPSTTPEEARAAEVKHASGLKDTLIVANMQEGKGGIKKINPNYEHGLEFMNKPTYLAYSGVRTEWVEPGTPPTAGPEGPVAPPPAAV